MSRLNLLQVCARRCDNCLFSPAALVTPARRREILADALSQPMPADLPNPTPLDQGAAFLCHVFTWKIRDGELAADDAQVVCRGFWDAYSDPPQIPLFVLALLLNNVVFVDFDGQIVDPATLDQAAP